MALSVNGTSKAGKKVADDRWARARNDMVEKQIITKGIRDSRVVEAMRRVLTHAAVQTMIGASMPLSPARRVSIRLQTYFHRPPLRL